MEVTAKTLDGAVIYSDSKILMTQATDSRGDAQKYGAHFKLGYVRDTSLQPLQTRTDVYEINFPYEDVEKEAGKPKERVIKAKEMEVTVVLRYQLDPAVGELGKDSFVSSFCKRAQIEQLMQDHRSGRRSEELRLWTLLGLEVFERRCLRNAGSAVAAAVGVR